VTGSREVDPGPLQATGERLIPELQHGELVHAEHLARYRLAAQLAHDRCVLDAACGDGYGAAILAACGAKSVTGVDIDSTAVAHARARYAVDFVVADVGALPFEEEAFDLVVSFETIEHVNDPSKALAELRRVLAKGGTLVISTPNTHEYLVDNEFHVQEFAHDEFVALLKDNFSWVEVMLQHNWLTSTVSSAEFAKDSGAARPHDVEFYKVKGFQPGFELYAVALCGEFPVEPLRTVAVAAGTDEAHRLAERLTSAEETAESWHREYQKAEATARDWHREFQKAERLAKEHGLALNEVYDSASWRLTEPLRRGAAFIRGRRG
jgi:SAM-dependent methyltransferase